VTFAKAYVCRVVFDVRVDWAIELLRSHSSYKFVTRACGRSQQTGWSKMGQTRRLDSRRNCVAEPFPAAAGALLSLSLFFLLTHPSTSKMQSLNATRSARPTFGGGSSRRLAVRVRADKCLIVNTKVRPFEQSRSEKRSELCVGQWW